MYKQEMLKYMVYFDKREVNSAKRFMQEQKLETIYMLATGVRTLRRIPEKIENQDQFAGALGVLSPAH
jgi:hypothetical protein